MDAKEIVDQAKTLLRRVKRAKYITAGHFAETAEFLRNFAGERSAFYKVIGTFDPDVLDDADQQERISSTIEAFIRYAESGLLESISIQRQAQNEVVSDFLEQAGRLLSSKDLHPAAAAVIIGGSLEEFLRVWTQEADLSLGGRKPSIDAYKDALRRAELLTPQDVKDITSWAGMRNDAAHGDWDKVADRDRVALMLDAVNLFMRQHGR